MSVITTIFKRVHYSVAKAVAPVPVARSRAVEVHQIAPARLGVLEPQDYHLARVSDGAVGLLRERAKCQRFNFERVRRGTTGNLTFGFTLPNAQRVSLLQPPTTHDCLQWKLPKIGAINPSEYCFVPTQRGLLPLLQVPEIVSHSTEIFRPADDHFLACIEPSSPEVPTNVCLAFKIAVPQVADCSNLLWQLVQVSINLFKPLGKAPTGGKDYARSSAMRPTQTTFPIGERHDGDASDTGYRKSYTERKSGGGGMTRQGMTIWDLLLPLLQPPPFDLTTQEQVFLPAELLPHQPDGVRFLATREAALLGDGVQTGKTIQSIVAMKLLFQTGKIDSALIVCPIPLLIHWQKELEKWAPELWQGLTVVRSVSRDQRRIMWRMPAHLYATNYETLVADFDEILAQRGEKGFGLIVADEIQRIKNPGTESSKKLKELGKAAKYRWGLSATPLENTVEDVVSIFEFLKAGLLRRNLESADSAKRKIQPHFLRRKTADVVRHFKEPRHDNYFVEMEGRQLEAYEMAFRESVAELKRMGERVTLTHALAKLQALKQLCNVHLPSGESAKLEWLLDTLEEIKASGDKALVFTQYIESGRDFLDEQFSKFGCVNYGRGTTDGQRRAGVEMFLKDATKAVFLANPKVAGVGLPDLKVANYVIHFDHWWNPAVEDQASGRILGIGQKKDAFIVHLWVENSIEGRIQAILARKRDLFGRVIDAQSNVDGTGLTEEEFFDLFGLQAPPRKSGATRPAASEVQATQANQAASSSAPSRAQLPSEPRALRSPQELSPTEFEDLVAEVFKKQGYSVRRTQQTRGEGVDVIAIRDHPTGRDKLAIQCKRQEKPVGRPERQKLLGVITADPSYSAGVLVTGSTFSTDAIRFAEQNARIRLVDKNALARLLVQNRVVIN